MNAIAPATAAQVYFDDVEIGTELPGITKGPLSVIHLMRWSSATENFHRIHYDHRFATEHDKVPDVLVNGSLKQQFMLEFLRKWAGLEGWVWKASFQFRAMDLPGSVLTTWGRVKAKTPYDAFGVVDLEIGIKNPEGRESVPGTAAIALPYRGGKPVPYPFRPPSAKAGTAG
ncbi:MAG TPA: acyl dehydratase [Devosia sp.]|nr:acyl dehydratase [Devosia sp.]